MLPGEPAPLTILTAGRLQHNRNEKKGRSFFLAEGQYTALGGLKAWLFISCCMGGRHGRSDEGGRDITILPTDDIWFGVIYKEDKSAVMESIRKLIAAGEYGEDLYGDL